MSTKSKQQHGSGLSIQDRIRAMNDTLDSVERSPVVGMVVTNDQQERGSNSSPLPEASTAASSSPLSNNNKRSSVIDIWRKRESSVNAGTDPKNHNNSSVANRVPTRNVEPTRRVTQPKVSVTATNSVPPKKSNEGITEYQETLDDVKTELSSRFHVVCDDSVVVAIGAVASTPSSSSNRPDAEEKKDPEESDDQESHMGSKEISSSAFRRSTTTTTTKMSGSLRGIASASPTPPPLPHSHRKGSHPSSVVPAAKAATKPSGSSNSPPVRAKTIPHHDDEPADLTILPASSTTSSMSEVTTSRRNNRVADMWKQLTTSGGGRGVSNESILPAPVPPEPTIVHTPPTQKRSVVDIWQKRASPKSAGDTDNNNNNKPARSNKIVVTSPLPLESTPSSIESSSPSPHKALQQPRLSPQTTTLKQRTSPLPRLDAPLASSDPVTISSPSLKSLSPSTRKWQQHLEHSTTSFDSARTTATESNDPPESPSMRVGPTNHQSRAKTRGTVDLDIVPAVSKEEGSTTDGSPRQLDGIRNQGSDLTSSASAHERNEESMASTSVGVVTSSPGVRSGSRVAERWKARVEAQVEKKPPSSVLPRGVSARWNPTPAANNNLSTRSLPAFQNSPLTNKKTSVYPGQTRGSIESDPKIAKMGQVEEPIATDQCEETVAVPALKVEDMGDDISGSKAVISERKQDIDSASVSATVPGSRRGKVTDRYLVPGASKPSPGGGSPSLSGSVSSLVKDYVVRTPAGVSRSKVAGRWTDSKGVVDDDAVRTSHSRSPVKTISSNDSGTDLGSGLNIIEAWVESKAEPVGEVPTAGARKLDSTTAPNNIDASGEEIEMTESASTSGEARGRGNVASRWISGSSSTDDGTKLSIESRGEIRPQGKVTDRWKVHATSSVAKSTFDRETVAELLNVGSGQKVQPELPHSVASNPPSFGPKTLQGNSSHVTESAITRTNGKISERWINRNAVASSTVLSPRLAVTPLSVAAIVKEHVQQTPFGSKKVDKTKRLSQTSDVDGVSLEIVSTSPRNEGQETSSLQQVDIVSLNSEPIAVESESSTRTSTQVRNTSTADRWKKRLAHTEMSLGGTDPDRHDEVALTDCTEPTSSDDQVGLETDAEHNLSPVEEMDLACGEAAVDQLHEIEGTETESNEASSEKNLKETLSGSSGTDVETTLINIIPDLDGAGSNLISDYSRESVASLKRELNEVTSAVASNEIPSVEERPSAGELSVFNTCDDENVQQRDSFVPVESTILAPVGDEGVPSAAIHDQRPDPVGQEQGDEMMIECADVDLGSPLRIIDAWSQKFVAMSNTQSSLSKEGNEKETIDQSLQGSTVLNDVVSSTGNLHGKETGTNSALKESPDGAPASPFQIIEAWSQKSTSSSAQMLSSAQLPRPTTLRQDAIQSETEKPDVKLKDSVVRPANSSAFAPWNGKAEALPENGLGVKDETPVKSKKNLMILGRKHTVQRATKKQDNTIKVNVDRESLPEPGSVLCPENAALVKYPSLQTDASSNVSSSVKNLPPAAAKQNAADEIAGGVLRAKMSATGSHDSGVAYQLSTPVVSNRRSIDGSLGFGKTASSTSSSQGDDEPKGIIITPSTRKLASDKMSNRQRLQSYRRKVNKPVSSEVESQNRFEMSAKVDPPAYLNDLSSGGRTSDQESQVTGPNPQVAPFDSDSLPQTATGSIEMGTSSFDADKILSTASSEACQSNLSDYDNTAFDDICKTSSTVTSSSLANKAEKVLQLRRKRSQIPNEQLLATGEASRGHDSQDNAFAGAPPRIDIPQSAQYALKDPPLSYHTDHEEQLLDNGRPSLSTRYNTSSRFMDADGSTTSMSAHGTTTDGSESIGSSCIQSTETGTTASDIRHTSVRKGATKRRPINTKGTSMLSEEKSLNTSQNGAWDSDWMADVSMISFDFNKLATAVDERVAALRDLVGVGAPSTARARPNLALRSRGNDLSEVEDIAIEVEYVEDSSDDDNPEGDLGVCTAPIDNAVHRSLQCPADTKTALGVDFPSTCSEMLPAGEPSFEQKPTSRRSGRRTGYV